MCGRYASSVDLATLVREFEAESLVSQPLTVDYNVAPTKEAYLVHQGEHGAEIEVARWGLVPSWAKDRTIGQRLINARSETVAEKPSFRAAFARRRCLVPADGYYEWYRPTIRAKGAAKQPFFIRPQQRDEPWAMAGIYEFWRDPTDDSSYESFAIITRPASDNLTHIHDRMPVTLSKAQFDVWLESSTSPEELMSLMANEPRVAMEAYPISTKVNSVRNNGPDLIAPIPPAGDLLFT
ncbi:MAG: hypothetical protein RJB01_1607 [Actinomycetota bacterium]|jgi:putative SOS response-associated peptidase YedK